MPARLESPVGKVLALGRHVPLASSLGLLVLAVGANAALQPYFFTSYSIQSNLNTFVPIIAAAVGQTIIILGGGIDLSLGTIITLVDVTVVTVMGGSPERIPLALAAGLLVGIAAGAVNGVAVAVLRLQPIVATFATSFVWTGLTLFILPRPGGSVPPVFYQGYRGFVAGVPVSAWVIGAIAVAWYLLRRRRIMGHIYAVGGDETAAFETGVDVVRVKITSYVLGGLFAAVAGIAIVADTATGDPFVGGPITMTSITAAVIGGTRLSGGFGGAGGSIVGAMILGLIQNIIFFANVPTYYQELINGAIVIGALAMAALPGLRRQHP